MTRSPEEVIGEAQAAKARGDLAAFFSLFDRKDQVRLAINAMAGLVGEEPRARTRFAELCDVHAIVARQVEHVRSLVRELVLSAQRMRELPPETRGSASAAHFELVKRHQEAVTTLVESMADLPRFLADAEGAFRQLHGGGLVSSSLFLGEHLEDVVVQGNRAWATRVGMSSGGTRWMEDVGFVRSRSGEWRIRPLAKRPRATSKGA